MNCLFPLLEVKSARGSHSRAVQSIRKIVILGNEYCFNRERQIGESNFEVTSLNLSAFEKAGLGLQLVLICKMYNRLIIKAINVIMYMARNKT